MLQLEITGAPVTGHPLPPRDKAIVELANNLLQSQQVFNAQDQVDKLFDELTTHLLERFEQEKRLFLDKGIPHAGEHMAQHETILKQAAILWERHRSGMLSMGELYRFLAVDLVKEHMGVQDQKTVQFLKQFS